MNTIEILKEELGEERIKTLEDNALLMLVEWSMIQYHESKVKNLGIPSVMPSWREFRSRRKQLGLSMDDVAKMVGCSKATISRLEAGNEVYYSTVKAIHDCYTSNGV